MEGNRKGQQMLIVALIVAIVTMSIGFAVTSYTTTLAIEGNTVTAKAAKWDVHFDDASYNETTGEYVSANLAPNTVIGVQSKLVFPKLRIIKS